MKTLNELWEENGEKPIDVKHSIWTSGFAHIIAKTPRGQFIGWTDSGQSFIAAEEMEKEWQLYSPINSSNYPKLKAVFFWLKIIKRFFPHDYKIEIEK